MVKSILGFAVVVIEHVVDEVLLRQSVTRPFRRVVSTKNDLLSWHALSEMLQAWSKHACGESTTHRAGVEKMLLVGWPDGRYVALNCSKLRSREVDACNNQDDDPRIRRSSTTALFCDIAGRY
jgi:hypothetical protein